MKAALKRLALALGVCALFAVWYMQSRKSEVAVTGGAGGLIQEATPQMIADHVKSLGKNLVLVNFWASWCGPCKEEFPNLLKLRDELSSKGFDVVFISIDGPQEREAAENFLKAQKVSFRTYYKGTQPLSFVTQIYPGWSGAVPASVIVSSDMHVLDAWEGDTSLEEFTARVTKQLGGKGS
jgi:thiol-disulfide isomerase/thioredoxin